MGGRGVFLSAALALGLLAQAQATGPVPVAFGPDLRLSGDQSYADSINQDSVAVAVSPADPSVAAAVFHDYYPTINDLTCRVAHSADGGRSWALGGILPHPIPGRICSDPSIAVDPSGNFFASYIHHTSADSSIVVARSSDGGQTFDSFATAYAEVADGEFADAPRVGADPWPSSPHGGTVYVGWTRFTTAPSGRGNKLIEQTEIQVQASRDGGATWTPPAPVSRHALLPEKVLGVRFAVAPDGTAYVFWADYHSHTGPTKFSFSKSSDGGRTWSAAADALTGLPSPGEFTLKNADRRWARKGLYYGIYTTSALSAAAGPDGTLFLAWVDFPNGSCAVTGKQGPPCVNADVRLSLSRDGGATWTAPVRANDDGGQSDQFNPWMTVHPDGLASLIWLDRRLDPANIDYNVYYTNTAGGGVFLPNVRVTSATSVVGSNGNLGVWNGLAATPDGVIAAWADQRSGTNVRIFTARGDLQP
jgi:hypothetical protein